ncbi:unnamed protein product, partial [Meganyctiphanes norvegica]
MMTTVSTATTFEALDQGLRDSISTLSICASLRGGWGPDTVLEVSSIATELGDIKWNIEHLKDSMTRAKQDLKYSVKLKEKMLNLSKRLDHMKTNLPHHLPTNKSTGSSASAKVKEEVNNAKDNKENVSPQKTLNNQNKSATKQITIIEYITVEEFESVPKYIRGRLQYDQVNNIVDQINKTLEAKYTLLRKPRAKASDVEMKQITACKRQENNETKGLYFVVDEDLKRWSSLKLDPAVRSMLTVLRTLKRLREVRGPGSLVRYAALL